MTTDENIAREYVASLDLPPVTDTGVLALVATIIVERNKDKMDIRDYVRQSRADQGLPPTVEDPQALARIASILKGADDAVDRYVEAAGRPSIHRQASTVAADSVADGTVQRARVRLVKGADGLLFVAELPHA